MKYLNNSRNFTAFLKYICFTSTLIGKNFQIPNRIEKETLHKKQ